MRKLALPLSLALLAAACAAPSPAVHAVHAAPLAAPAPVVMAPSAPAASSGAVVGAAPSIAPTAESPWEHALALHRSAIVVDGHNDITSAIFDRGFDLAKPDGKTHTDLPRMKAGGITGEFFAIYVDAAFAEKPTPLGGGAARRALDMIDITYQQIERHPESLVLATSAEDIRRAKREGKIAVLMGIEGGHAIENSLFALREFHRLGVRYMTLTHVNNNDWADSAGFGEPVPPRHHGLTPFGEDVVREMQRVGMLVDISHVSDETFAAVMRVAKAPVIASHSSARALSPHPRNMTDDMLRALAKNDGVAMVNFYAGFIDPHYAAASAAFRKKNAVALKELRARFKDDHAAYVAGVLALKQKDAFPGVPLSILIDHIDHVAKVAGIDHVGLGSDFDGVDALPDELHGIEDLPKITFELLKRGYTDEQILKILGGNFLRVFEAAEAYAKGTHTTLSGDGNTAKIPR